MRRVYVLLSFAVISSTVLGLNADLISNKSEHLRSVKNSLLKRKEVEKERDKELRSEYSTIKRALESQDWEYRRSFFVPLLELLNEGKRKNSFTRFLTLSKIKKNLKRNNNNRESRNRLSAIIRFSSLIDSQSVIRLILCKKNQIPLKKDKIEELTIRVFRNVQDLIESCQERFPFHYACEKGYENLVKYFVEGDMVNINQIDDEGKTPLFHACSSGNENLVKYLMEKQGTSIKKNEDHGKSQTVTLSSEPREFPDEDSWVIAYKALSKSPFLYRIGRGC